MKTSLSPLGLPFVSVGLLCLLAILAPRMSAQDMELFNPRWSITIDDFSYSDLAFDQRPGFEGREYLSGEWAAAVSYVNGGNPMGPTWLNPEFIFPDWTSNSDFGVETGIEQLPGTNAWGFPVFQSVITNAALRIEITSQFVDTTNGTPQGLAAKSGPTGAHVLSDRYVFRQSFAVSNISGATLTAVRFYKFLHSLQATRAVYDDRNYGGAFNGHRYTASQQGIDVGYLSPYTGNILHLDTVALHANLTPAAWEVGRYGVVGIDSHAFGKPSVGVHLSVEAGALSGLDLFAPSNLWVSGAVRCDLGTLAPNAVTNVEFLMSLGTVTVAPPTEIIGWGNGTNGRTTAPAGLSNIIGLAAGGAHNLAIKLSGEVIGWGSNSNGQTTIPANATNVTAVAAGGAHSLALLRDGSLLAWGSNASGQTNVPAAGFNSFTVIAAGNAHSVAARIDGTVVAWGTNANGQTNVPASATNVYAVAAGDAHCLALRYDSTVVAWGDNSSGQANVPAGLTNVLAIAAGGMHNLALRLDGTVVAWGNNSAGQTNLPAGLTNIQSIAAGGLHSLALGYDGKVFAWGGNASGQTNFPATLPLPLGLAAGGSHSLAVVPVAPVLHIARNTVSNLVLSCSAVWSPAYAGGVLEQTTSITNPAWSSTIGAAVLDQLEYRMTLPLPPTNTYFRMRLP